MIYNNNNTIIIILNLATTRFFFNIRKLFSDIHLINSECLPILRFI